MFCFGLVFGFGFFGFGLFLFLFFKQVDQVGVVYRTLPSIFAGEDLDVFPEHDPSWMHSSDNVSLCWETLLEEQSRLHPMDHPC